MISKNLSGQACQIGISDAGWLPGSETSYLLSQSGVSGHPRPFLPPSPKRPAFAEALEQAGYAQAGTKGVKRREGNAGSKTTYGELNKVGYFPQLLSEKP